MTKDMINRLVNAMLSANGALLRYSRIAPHDEVARVGLQAAVFSLQSSSTALLELINGLRLEAHVLLS